MTNGSQKFRERAPGEQAPAEMQHFQYERTLLNNVEGNMVLYRFGSDTIDLSRLSDNDLRGRLAEELRKPNPAISVFQTGSVGTEIEFKNEFLRNRVADRLEDPGQNWGEGGRVALTGPPEISVVATEAVPAEREAARWATYRSETMSDGTYFSMRVNETALSDDQRRDLANLQYKSPDEWQRFANSLGNRAIEKVMHVGTG